MSGRREDRTMPSGAEVWSFPSQHPELTTEREHFYAFLDCLCVGGREYTEDLHLVQCASCWTRHFDHPETQRVHEEQLAALDAGTNEVDHYFPPRKEHHERTHLPPVQERDPRAVPHDRRRRQAVFLPPSPMHAPQQDDLLRVRQGSSQRGQSACRPPRAPVPRPSQVMS